MKLSLSILWLLGIVSMEVRAADKYQYVIDATNQITQTDSQRADPSAEALASAGTLACNTLTRLLKDTDFRTDLDKMKATEPKTRELRAAMRRDLKQFVESFMTPEEAALRKAGLKDEAVRQLLWSANMFEKALTDNYDPTRILTAMENFRKEVCSSGKTFEGAADAAARRVTFQRWAFRLGGIAIIVADLAASAPTAAVAAGSVAIGTAIMSWP